MCPRSNSEWTSQCDFLFDVFVFLFHFHSLQFRQHPTNRNNAGEKKDLNWFVGVLWVRANTATGKLRSDYRLCAIWLAICWINSDRNTLNDFGKCGRACKSDFPQVIYLFAIRDAKPLSIVYFNCLSLFFVEKFLCCRNKSDQFWSQCDGFSTYIKMLTGIRILLV